MSKFDQYQPKRTDIKSSSRIIKQFRSCNLKHWYAGTVECYSADQSEDRGICYGFIAK